MKVRFLGLGFNSGDGISLNDFMDNLSSKNGKEFDFNGYKRFCYVQDLENEKYIAGLFLTIKDQKKFCELKNNKGNLQVKVNTLDANSNLIDFNFFIINNENGLCLYQHYHNSCSANQFGLFLRQRYKEYQELMCKNAKKSKESITKKQEALINKRYKKSLTWELMVRAEKIDELLEELDTIRAFEIDFFSLQADEPVFTPMTNLVSKERRSFSFIKKTQASVLTPTIKDIISKFDIRNGRIFGKDIDGIEKIIKISENPDNFGEYEYDELAEKLQSLDMNNFYKNWVVTELLNKAQEFKYIFEASIKDDN